MLQKEAEAKEVKLQFLFPVKISEFHSQKMFVKFSDYSRANNFQRNVGRRAAANFEAEFLQKTFVQVRLS